MSRRLDRLRSRIAALEGKVRRRNKHIGRLNNLASKLRAADHTIRKRDAEIQHLKQRLHECGDEQRVELIGKVGRLENALAAEKERADGAVRYANTFTRGRP